MKTVLQQALRAAALSALLCAGHAALAADAAPAAANAVQAAAVWPAGEYRWAIDDGHGEPPYTLRLYMQPLPTGDYALTGSLLLDDAELGAHGSARVRDGKLILDLTASGGVLQAPMEEDKRRLYPKGKAPERVDSAGFATMRVLLDPATLGGVVQRYQTNVMTGHLVQGPMYANSVIRRLP
ncbi:hypothetical protein RAS12_23875 [Achromobacter seleniivolatilans]|uniref:Uncharacterized protein n=1 Tax=Achromobacter seleniivolatilans TaxID=3047478 RepID=A0ABY9LYT7_9BURK|nr:hypothetical protein [Achromobacter sp. R39]WMD19630.1 hypothetical protein RAS12_23875 [Achromobacter sp. R39]